MNRVVHTAAAAAAFALFSTTAARDARAQLVYESFNYPAGSSLDEKINPIDGQPWSVMSNNAADDDIVVSGGNLAYPGFAAPFGNSATFSGTGKSERLGFERTARSGELYYSLVLRVSSLGAMTSSPTFVAGFSDRAGESGLPPTTVGTRLYLRQGPNSAPGAETFNVGVSKNSSFDITFGAAEYALNTPLLVVGSYQIVGAASGEDDVARLYVNPTSLGSAAAPTGSTPASPILTAPVAGTDLTVGGVPSLAGFVLRQGTGVPGVQVDELRVDTSWARVTPPAGVAWNVDAGGAWSEGAKWSSGSAPNAADAFVNFNGNISAARTITLDAPVALRSITFNSNPSYTLAAGGGGAGAVNLSAAGGVNVRRGSHTIAVPVTLGGEALFSVATGSTLHLTGEFAGNGHAVTKAGDGTMTVKHLRAGRADLVAGTVAVAPNGGPAATSRVTSLAIEPGAALDLSNNDLVIDYAAGTPSPLGSATNGVYNGLTALVVSGKNGDAWNGTGIRTSQSDARTGLTTLAISEAAAALALDPGRTGMWSGQVVDDTSVLVRYTYAGDANLDGYISGDDYSAIDFGILFPGMSGYANGDFNYDGFITGDDYSVIDLNILLQGQPLGDAPTPSATPSLTAVSAVPEPGALAVGLAVAAATLVRRRRRGP